MKTRGLIEPDDGGVCVAQWPALPGCASQGRTHGEAVANIRDAMEGIRQRREKHGEPVLSPIAEEMVEAVV